MRHTPFFVISLFLLLPFLGGAQTQPDYIPEQLGRDSHHIIQSLGAFVGNERAESQAFDITYMPAGNGVDGIMIINTADYRCTFKLDQQYDMCYELAIDIRSQEFLTQFYNLFAVYRTENMDDYRIMSFGNEKLRVSETPSTTSKYRSFKFTIE
ncbi:MAG: hypothetical protein IKG81_11220 [Bacteroidales bacterium]|nr:hypothetical protein [Bacteroidales bacterium]